MRKNLSIARLVCVFAVSIALISYNTYSFCFKGRAEKITVAQIPADNTASSFEEASPEGTASAETPLKEVTEESRAASTDSSVRGKIISRYINIVKMLRAFFIILWSNQSNINSNKFFSFFTI